MTYKLHFVVSYILDGDYVAFANLHHFIYQKEWITMWQQIFYTVNIHYTFRIDIYSRYKHIVFTYLFPYLPRKCSIHGMSGTFGYDSASKRTSYKRKIAYQIHQFMTCRLVIEPKVCIDITKFIRLRTRLPHKVGYTLYFALCHLLIVYNDCIVEVTAFYQIVFEQ